jgi:hypothetical protein
MDSYGGMVGISAGTCLQGGRSGTSKLTANSSTSYSDIYGLCLSTLVYRKKIIRDTAAAVPFAEESLLLDGTSPILGVVLDDLESLRVVCNGGTPPHGSRAVDPAVLVLTCNYVPPA